MCITYIYDQKTAKVVQWIAARTPPFVLFTLVLERQMPLYIYNYVYHGIAALAPTYQVAPHTLRMVQARY